MGIGGAFWGLQSVIHSSGKKRLEEVQLPTMVLVCAATLSSSTLLLQNSVPLASPSSRSAFCSSFLFNRENGYVVPLIVVCHAKKKLSFVDQILDYIEGGYFLDIPQFLFVLIIKFPSFCFPSSAHIHLSFCSFLGGPKLRKWYGAPDLLPKDGTATEDDEDDYPGT